MAKTDDTVSVRVINDREEAADFGSWQTYNLAGTEQAFEILPLARKRHRAVLYFVLPAFGFLYVGTRAQVQARQGGGLQGTGTIVIENQQDLWCMPDGSHVAYLVVLDERYANVEEEESGRDGE